MEVGRRHRKWKSCPHGGHRQFITLSALPHKEGIGNFLNTKPCLFCAGSGRSGCQLPQEASRERLRGGRGGGHPRALAAQPGLGGMSQDLPAPGWQRWDGGPGPGSCRGSEVTAQPAPQGGGLTSLSEETLHEVTAWAFEQRVCILIEKNFSVQLYFLSSITLSPSFHKMGYSSNPVFPWRVMKEHYYLSSGSCRSGPAPQDRTGPFSFLFPVAIQ